VTADGNISEHWMLRRLQSCPDRFCALKADLARFHFNFLASFCASAVLATAQIRLSVGGIGPPPARRLACLSIACCKLVVLRAWSARPYYDPQLCKSVAICMCVKSRSITVFRFNARGRRRAPDGASYYINLITSSTMSTTMPRTAIRAGTFPSIIWFKAGLHLLEVQFKCLLSLQARYATNQRVARTIVCDRDSINRRQPSQPETAVRFNVQANARSGD
jgi:hypothetical protein